MLKKLTLLFVAFVAIVAFATQAGRRAGATKLIDYPTSKDGITLTSVNGEGSATEDVAFGKVKIKSNATEVDGIKFGKTFKNGDTEKYYAKITVEGGFKAGDVIKIAGAINNSDASKNGAIEVHTAPTKSAVWTTEQFVNGQLSAEEPAVQEYTLTEAAEALYMGRKGNTATYITSLTIERVDVATVSGDSLWSSKAPVAIGEGIENITLKAEKVKLSSKFAAGGKIKVGIDEITSTDDPLTKESAKIQLYAGEKQLTEEAQIGKFEAPGVYEFTLTGAMVKAIADNDSLFTVKGTYFKTSKIAYEAGSAMEATSVWVGTAVNKLEVPGYVFENIGINVGSYIKIKAAKTALASRRANAENDEIILKKAGGAAFSDDELKIDEEGYNAIVLTDGAANELKFNGLVVEVKDNSAITKFTEVDVVVGKAITLTDTKVGSGNGTTTVPSAAAPGQTVTIKPAPATGSVVLSVKATYQVTNDEGTETKDVNVAKGKDESDNEIYTFTMPDYPVALKVTYAPEPEDITVTMDAAGDLSAAIDAAFENKNPNAKSMTINLNAAGTYTLNKSITSAGGVTITGVNGAVIDASELESAMIKFAGSTTFELKSDGKESAYYYYGDVSIQKVEIKNLKQSLAQSTQKSMIKSFVIDDCIINMEANKVVFDFNSNATYAETWTIKNSTIWSKAGNNKYLIQTNAKCPDIDADHKCVITLENNTFYQIAKGSQLNNGNQFKGKNYVEINLKNNIFAYTGNAAGNSIKGLCFGQAQENMIKTFDKNTFFADADESANWGKMKDNALVTDPEFVDAANGDFHLGAGSQQAKFQTGDPRWVTSTTYDASKATPVDLTVEVKEGKEIAAAIDAAITDKQVDIVGNLTVKLGATSTIANPIEIGGVKGATLTLTGSNGSTIDASGLTDAFIQLSATPTVTNNGKAYVIPNIVIKNATINGLTGKFVYNNNVNYCVEDLTIDNCVVKLATTSAVAFLDFEKSAAEYSAIKNLTVKNSTFYQTGTSDINYFVRYKNNARLDRLGYDTTTDTQGFVYLNNTFYNIAAASNWANYSGYVGQRYTTFEVKNNIWVNCGNGNIPNKILGGRSASSYTQCEFGQNTYMKADGTFEAEGSTSSSFDASGTALTHDPGFVDAANGDFTLGAMTAQAEYQTGDPRWLVTYVSPENTDEMKALAEEIDKAQTLLGNSDTSVDPGASLAVAIQSAIYLYNNTKYADELEAVAKETTALKTAENKFADNVLGAEIVKANGLYEQYKSDCASPYAANNFYYEIRRATRVDQNSDQYTGQELNAALLRLIAAEEAFLTDAGIDPSTYVTGIEGIKADNLEGAVIYDLNGKRVEKPAKGLYIVNGKKVVIK